MIRFILIAALSIVSGTVAGMGMGGGTLLIPFLTIFLGVPQKIAQVVNLLAFVPMAIVTFFIYLKKKMINFSYSWLIIVSACPVSFFGSLLMFGVSSNVLKICFGFFIAVIGIFSFIMSFKKKNS